MALTPQGSVPEWMVGSLATAISVMFLMCMLSWMMIYIGAHMKHEHVQAWFQHWRSMMPSLTQEQADDLELGITKPETAKRRRKKPSSVLRQIANQRRKISNLLTFLIGDEDVEEYETEIGPFDLNDNAWLEVMPKEQLPSAMQHFIGDDDSSHDSPRSQLCSGDAFALGDDAWQMHGSFEAWAA